MDVAATQEFPVVWLQLSACSGCAVSFLNSSNVTVRALLIDELIPGTHVNLRFLPTIMAASGQAALEVLEGTQQEGGYLLVVEGSVPTAEGGVYGGVGEMAGKHVRMADKVADLAGGAIAVVALGACSSFGGIFAAEPDPTGCKPVSAVLAAEGIDVPVINIPGCPPHPDWFVGTVAKVLLQGLPGPEDVDDLGRPLEYFGSLIHENCPRRADFDAGKFARRLGDEGCLYLLGCKGPMAYADCPKRQWNTGTNWCIGSNHPCIACVEPGFPDKISPMFEKLTEERLERFFVRTRE